MVLNYILSIFFILFPVSLVAGVFYSNLVISVLAIYGLYLSLKKKNWYVYKNFFVRFFLLFYLYICIRSFYSIDPLLSLESSITYVRFLFFALAVYFLINNNRNILKYFTISLISILLFVSFDAFYQYIYGINIFGWAQQDPERVSSFFREELILGSFVSRLTPLTIIFLVILFDTSKIINKLFVIFLILILAAAIFISGERTALFFFLLSTSISILLISKVRIYYVLSMASLLVCAGILSFLNPNFKSRMISDTINQMNIGSKFDDIKIFSEHHERLYFSAIKMFQHNPIVGHGPKTFRLLCSKPEFNPGACSTHPHHTYLQLFAEIGIVGTFFVLTFFVFISYKLFNKFIRIYFLHNSFRDDALVLTLLICMLISLWPFSPSANFFSSWINGFYYLPLGIYFYENFKKNN